MQLNSRALKVPAWSAMRAAVPPALLVTLAYILLTDVLSDLTSLLTPALTVDELIYRRGAGIWAALFLAVLLGLYRVVMSFGYQAWALRAARSQQAGYGALLDGFGMVGRVLLMEVQIFLRVLGWTLGLSIIYAFMTTPLALFHNAAGVVWAVLTSILFYLAVAAVSMRYSLAPFLLWDYPDAGSTAAVRRSAEMMSGNLWSLFKLYLSFWPWYLGETAIEILAACAVLAPRAAEFTSVAASGGLSMAVSQIQMAMNAPFTSLLLLLAVVPLELFFLPYQHMAAANFYRALSGEPVVPQFSGETF